MLPRPSLRLRWIIAVLVAAVALAGVVVAVGRGTGDGVRIVPQTISGPVARQAGRAAQEYAPGASVLNVAEDAFDAAQFDVSVRLPSGRRETIAVDNRFHVIGLAPAHEGVGIGGQ